MHKGVILKIIVSLLFFLALFVLILWPEEVSAWSSDPTENTPVTTAPDNQTNPAATSDGAGGAIIAWQDQKNGYYWDIYAQRINSYGTPLWTLNGVAVATADWAQTSPQIAGDGSGGAIIAWEDYRHGRSAIYAQRVNSSGAALWTANGVRLAPVSEIQMSPQIISDNAGGAIVVWQDRRSGNYDIYGQRISPAGSLLWDPAGTVVATGPNNEVNPKIAGDGAGGAIIEWLSLGYVTSAPAPTPYPTPAPTPKPSPPPAFQPVQLIYSQRLNASGSRLWSDSGVAVATTPYQKSGSQIISDSSGGAILAWHEGRNQNYYNDIYTQRLNAYGTAQWAANGLAVSTAPYYKSGLQLAGDGTGGAIGVWYSMFKGPLNYSNNGIIAQRVNSSGSFMWTANGAAVSTAAYYQSNPQVIGDGSGGAVVAWEDSRNSNNPDIYAQRINSSGLPVWPGNGIPVSAAPRTQRNVKVVSGADNGVIAVWQDDRSNYFDIYATWISPSYIPDTTAPSAPSPVGPASGAYLYTYRPSFSWTKVTDASGVIYELQIASNDTFSGSYFGTVQLATASYIPYSIYPGSYIWRVRARDNASPSPNYSAWSSPAWSFNISLPYPRGPYGTIGTGTPTFLWTPVPYASVPATYDVQVAAGGDWDFSSPKVNKTGLASSSYALSSSEALAEGHYIWRVRARSNISPFEIGDWSYSQWFNIILPPSTPALIYPSSGYTLNTSKPGFAWSGVTSNSVVLYELQVDNNSSFSSPEVYKTYLLNSAYSLENSEALPPGSYFWRVRAENWAVFYPYNYSPWSSPAWSFDIVMSDNTPPPVPSPVSPSSGSALNTDNPVFTWTAVADPSPPVTYDFQMDNSSDFSSPEVQKMRVATNSYTLSAVEFLASGTYYWRVRARDNASPLNVSAWSSPPWNVVNLQSVQSFHPPLDLHPGQDSIIPTATPVFSWSAVKGFGFSVTYDFQVSENSSFSSPIISKTGLATSYYALSQSEALRDGGYYYWRVRARDNNIPANLSDWDYTHFSIDISGSKWVMSLSGSLEIRSPVGRPFSADETHVGQFAGALDGLDRYDVPEPPLPPDGQYLDMYVIASYGRNWLDARPISNYATFTFRVQTVGLEGDVRLTWGVSELPSKFDFMTLQDIKTGAITDMKSTSGYTYSSVLDERRSFSLYFKASSPPTVQVTHPNGGDMLGGTAAISASASDPDSVALYNDFVSTVTFFYSQDSGTSWNMIGPGIQSSTGTWTASWDTSGLPDGKKYRIKAIAYDSKGVSGEDISDSDFSVSERLAASSRLFQGWNMYSFPLNPDTGSISSQLNDRIATGLFVFHYDPVSGVYSLTDTATAGWGYWTKVNVDTDFEIKGLSTAQTIFELPVYPGWNQIGNPFNASINWGNVLVTKDGLTKTLMESQTAGWMNEWLYDYNPTSGAYETHSTADGRLMPFKGYWIKANVNGLTLIIPAS